MTTVAEARLLGRRKLESVDNPVLDADLILAHILGWDRESLFARDDRVLTDDQTREYDSLLSQRAQGRPVAYITGKKLWFGLELHVSEAVLIPRPETETLAESAIEIAGEIRSSETARHSGQGRPREQRFTAVDVATGSGAIALALATTFEDILVLATDNSPEALAVADGNIARYNLDQRVGLLRGDLITPVASEPDLIVANLPYVPTSDLPDLSPEVLAEPHAALFAGVDGTDSLRRLLHQVVDRGWRCPLVLEIDPRQGQPLLHLVSELFPGSNAELRKDLSGRERVLVVRFPAGIARS